MLYRGKYQLGNQDLGTDEAAADVASNAGGVSYAFMLNEKEAARFHGYRYVCQAPGRPSLPWTAFRTREELQHFCDAYRIELDAEPEPGCQCQLRLPPAGTAFVPLHEDLVFAFPGKDGFLDRPADKLRRLLQLGQPLTLEAAKAADEHGNLQWGDRDETILKAAGWQPGSDGMWLRHQGSQERAE